MPGAGAKRLSQGRNCWQHVSIRYTKSGKDIIHSVLTQIIREQD